MQNLEDTILSQYANSPVLLSLITSANDAIDPAQNITDFYNDIWNVDTATGYGLDVWGRIVGVTRIINVPGGNYLGFSEGGYDTFGHSPLYDGVPSTSNYALSDNAFRLLILAKAFSNISDSSSKTYNTILMQLFPGRGNAYVSDTGDMHSRLTFEFLLQPFEISILKQSGAFQAPCGVKFEIMDLIPSSTFSFLEAGGGTPFGTGALFKGFE